MNNITIFFCIFKVQTKEQNVMLSDNKVIEIFYMADDFCIFLMKQLKNILLRKRALIESTNDELKNIAQIEHSRHRSFSNFIVNTIAAIAAYCYFPKKHSISIEHYHDKQLVLF